MELGEKASRLILFAHRLAANTPGFFETKGPGEGDIATNEFMAKVCAHAKEMFGRDYSNARICGKTSFSIDFYFPDEQTAVELAFSLDKPRNEFELDIFKCLLAQDNGHPVRKLVLVCRPGGQARLSAPGPTAIKEWVSRAHNLEIDLWELVPGETINEESVRAC